MTIGETNFQNLAGEFRAVGFVVVCPTTGMYMSVTVGNDKVNWAEARALFAKANAANILIGIGSTLRIHLWEGINSGAIKLRDFGFRGRQ